MIGVSKSVSLMLRLDSGQIKMCFLLYFPILIMAINNSNEVSFVIQILSERFLGEIDYK